MPGAETIMAVAIVMCAVSLPFLLLRLYVRCYLQFVFSLSDAFLVLAWMCQTGACLINAVFPGFDAALSDLANPKWTPTMKAFYAAPFLAHNTMYLVKGSFLAFYLRLFPPVARKLRVCLWFTIFLTAGCYTAGMALQIFYCWPIQRNWASSFEELCIPWFHPAVWATWWATHCGTDLLIFGMPFVLLRYLRGTLGRTEMYLLIALFSLGGIVVLSMIPRIFLLVLNGDPVVYVTLAESELGLLLIVACCPPLNWFVTNARKRGIVSALRRPRSLTTKEVVAMRDRDHRESSTRKKPDSDIKEKSNNSSGSTSTSAYSSGSSSGADDVRTETVRSGIQFTITDPSDGYDLYGMGRLSTTDEESQPGN